MNVCLTVPLLFALTATLPVYAQDLSEEDVKRLALEAILENPDIIMQAVDILQRREEAAAAEASAAAITELQSELTEDPNAPVLGNPDGDVTVVEFFDYNCPYCKQAAKDVEALIENDPGVRVVYREWPILGEGSLFASRAALASRAQGKYEDFHWALMAERSRKDEAAVLRIAESVGLDLTRLQEDMMAPEVSEHIARSQQLASALGFNGTPSFVIGETAVPGMVPLDAMQQIVAEVRAVE